MRLSTQYNQNHLRNKYWFVLPYLTTLKAYHLQFNVYQLTLLHIKCKNLCYRNVEIAYLELKRGKKENARLDSLSKGQFSLLVEGFI